MKLFRNLVAGKKIALVGNAQSLLGQGFGAEIEACDLVLRMNAGFPIECEHQGERTDIWISSLGVPLEAVIDRFNPRLMLWATPKRHLLPEAYRRASIPLELHPKLTWWILKRRLGTRPSTGAIIANYLDKWCQPERISVFGFDHFKTKTFYENRAFKGPHGANQEASFFDSLYENGCFVSRGTPTTKV